MPATADKADLHAPQIADFRFNAVNVGSGNDATFDFDELRIGRAQGTVNLRFTLSSLFPIAHFSRN